MGQSSSRNSEFDLERKAANNLYKRIRQYNPARHGSYLNYVEWCERQFELECMQEITTNSDHK